MDHTLVFQLSWGYLNNRIKGHLGFTHDGEGGVTCHRRFRVSGILKVGGRQVDGQATIIAEAFEAVVLPFLLGELAVFPISRVGATCRRCIG